MPAPARYRVYNRVTEAYYHPDIHDRIVGWADALVWDDIGEAGYVCDQLNDRDDGRIVSARGRVTRLHADSWQVVDQARSPPD